MIQRIQTLYLLIADLLVATLFFLPLAEMVDKQGILYQLNVAGVTRDGVADGGELFSTLPLLLLAGILILLITMIIFQFKNRVRQIKLSYLALILLLVQAAVIYYYIWQYNNTLGGEYSLKVFSSFPLVAAVFIYLAIRGIVKDDNLVKSIDRIR